MKRLIIQREDDTDVGTFGKGSFEGGDSAEWDFIELPWRDNRQGVSRVPAGVYMAHLVASPHFHRRVYLLADVPGRSAVEMHPANWAGDVEKGFQSDLRGCCAPGMERGMLMNHNNQLQAAVLRSAVALDQIIEFAGDEPIEIEFVDPA